MTAYDLVTYAVTGVWGLSALLVTGLWAALALRERVRPRLRARYSR